MSLRRVSIALKNLKKIESFFSISESEQWKDLHLHLGDSIQLIVDSWSVRD